MGGARQTVIAWSILSLEPEKDASVKLRWLSGRHGRKKDQRSCGPGNGD